MMGIILCPLKVELLRRGAISGRFSPVSSYVLHVRPSRIKTSSSTSLMSLRSKLSRTTNLSDDEYPFILCGFCWVCVCYMCVWWQAGARCQQFSSITWLQHVAAGPAVAAAAPAANNQQLLLNHWLPARCVLIFVQTNAHVASTWKYENIFFFFSI